MHGFTEITTMINCGVYALCYNDDVLYIGQTTNILRRLHEHRNNSKRIRFNRVWFRSCEQEELDSIEIKMIHKYQPRFNKQGLSFLRIKATARQLQIIARHISLPDVLIRRY